MTENNILKGMTLRDYLWVGTLLIGAGLAIGKFATKDELRDGLEKTRTEQENKVDRALRAHDEQSSKDSDMLWKRLDRIEKKLDDINTKRR